MTSTLGRREPERQQGAGAAGLSDVSLVPRSRRRPGWMAMGVMLVAFAGLLGAYVLASVSDTLPVWTDLAENHQDEVLEILGTPIAERANPYETDLLDLAGWPSAGWDLDIALDLEAGL